MQLQRYEMLNKIRLSRDFRLTGKRIEGGAKINKKSH
jgi:hypothetical protein